MIEIDVKSLEKIIDVYNPNISEEARKLADSLSKYGFVGEVSINLIVKVEDKETRVEDGVVKRFFKFCFKR